MAALPGAACGSICSTFPFSRCLDWLSPVFRMHVQKHGVGASLGVTLQQSSFTLALLPIPHKAFPDKSCKTVLMAPGWLFAGESVLGHFASRAASEAVPGSPAGTGVCPQDLGPSLKVWMTRLLLRLEGSPLRTVQCSQELERALGTRVREGKLKCCRVWPCSRLLWSAKATPWASCLEEATFSAQLLPRGESPCACLQRCVCQQGAQGTCGVSPRRARLCSGQGTALRCLPRPRRGSMSSLVPSPPSPPLKHPHHYSSNWIPPLFFFPFFRKSL